MTGIDARDIGYDPRDTNSNASVDEALRGAGLPPATQDGPSGNWSPGSDFDMPGGDVIDFPGKSFGEELGDWMRDKIRDKVDDLSDAISDLFKGAQRFFPRYDPLTLDLDGDGLETLGFDPSRPVYFDHDLNGVKEGTGWVKPDDGFLVLDRNGNGVIDNGAELFGDHTPLSGGGYAADGFAALVQEDTNADGKVDASDARFASLRIWRDLNQNGISEADELTTLADANIAAINVAKTANSQTLANGNQIADLGTYTRTDGSMGGLGETHQLADVNLAADTFHRQFTTSIPPTTATALPDMQGSGTVRDLHIAANESVFEIRIAA